MPAPYSISITNPDAETGDMTGWSAYNGDCTNTMAALTSVGSTSGPHSGTYFFQHSSGSDEDYLDYAQVIDISSVPDATSELDNGSLMLDLRWWQANPFADDIGSVMVEFLDGSNNTLTGLLGLAPHETPGTLGDWQERQSLLRVPNGTRKIRLHMISILIAGSAPNVGFDDIEATLRTNTLGAAGTTARIMFNSSSGTPPTGLNEMVSGGSISDLDDTDGNATGWGFAINTGSLSAHNSADMLELDAIVPADGLVNTAFSHDVTFRFSGLTSGDYYRVAYSGGSRNTTLGLSGGDRLTMEFIVNGTTLSQNTWQGCGNRTEFIAAADGSGNLDVRVLEQDLDGPVTGIEIEELGSITPASGRLLQVGISEQDDSSFTATADNIYMNRNWVDKGFWLTDMKVPVQAITGDKAVKPVIYEFNDFTGSFELVYAGSEHTISDGTSAGTEESIWDDDPIFLPGPHLYYFGYHVGDSFGSYLDGNLVNGVRRDVSASYAGGVPDNPSVSTSNDPMCVWVEGYRLPAFGGTTDVGAPQASSRSAAWAEVGSSNMVLVRKVTVPADGTIRKVIADLWNIGGSSWGDDQFARPVVYDHDAVNDEPSDLLATGVSTWITFGQNELDLYPEDALDVTNGDVLWVGIHEEQGGYLNNGGGSVRGDNNTSTYGSAPPDPYPTPSIDTGFNGALGADLEVTGSATGAGGQAFRLVVVS